MPSRHRAFPGGLFLMSYTQVTADGCRFLPKPPHTPLRSPFVACRMYTIRIRSYTYCIQSQPIVAMVYSIPRCLHQIVAEVRFRRAQG